jgi:hypothetical protein
MAQIIFDFHKWITLRFSSQNPKAIGFRENSGLVFIAKGTKKRQRAQSVTGRPLRAFSFASLRLTTIL